MTFTLTVLMPIIVGLLLIAQVVTFLWLKRRTNTAAESVGNQLYQALIDENQERFEKMMPRLLDQIPTRLDPAVFEARVATVEGKVRDCLDTVRQHETRVKQCEQEWDQAHDKIFATAARAGRAKQAAEKISGQNGEGPPMSATERRAALLIPR